MAIAAAFSPNPDKPPFFVDYPFELVGGELTRVESVWQKWVAGMDVVAMVRGHRQSLRQLTGIRYGWGTYERDDLTGGWEASRALTELGIPHIFEVYPGGHLDYIPERMETRVLPFMSRALHGDLPLIQSATVDLGTVVAGQSIPEVSVVLAAAPEATGTFPELSLDLSSLGVSEALPLRHDGSGRYAARPSLTPLRSGRYALVVSLEEGTDTPFPLTQLTVDVWPAGDLQVMGDALDEGWTLEGQSSVTLDSQANTQVFEGRSSLAARTSGVWTIVLSPVQPVSMLGYAALRFALHPGDASGDVLNVQIGGELCCLGPGYAVRSDEPLRGDDHLHAGVGQWDHPISRAEFLEWLLVAERVRARHGV